MNRIEMHKNLCQELNDIYTRKNNDYGNSFGETFDKLGIISAVTRISDKYNRLVSLCTKSEEERRVKDESITDTLLDMANYCIMTVIEMHKDENNNVNNCEHNWEYVATDIGNSPTSEFHRCTRCGEVKKVNIEAL